jgi:hypothetical protein
MKFVASVDWLTKIGANAIVIGRLVELALTWPIGGQAHFDASAEIPV